MELTFYTGLLAFAAGIAVCWSAIRHQLRVSRANRDELATEFESLIKRHAALKHKLRALDDGDSDQAAKFSRTFEKLRKIETTLEVVQTEKHHAETERDLLRSKLQQVSERADVKSESDQQELERKIHRILELEEQLDEMQRRIAESISAGILEHIKKAEDTQARTIEEQGRQIEDAERKITKLDHEYKRLEKISENLRLEKEHYQKEFMMLFEKQGKPEPAAEDDNLKKAG